MVNALDNDYKKVHACYAVKIVINKPLTIFKRGGGGALRCAGAGSAFAYNTQTTNYIYSEYMGL